MSSVRAVAAGTPSWQTRTTWSVIGMSTPASRASSAIETHDFTPSAVCLVAATACSSVSPRPSR